MVGCSFSRLFTMNFNKVTVLLGLLTQNECYVTQYSNAQIGTICALGAVTGCATIIYDIGPKYSLVPVNG